MPDEAAINLAAAILDRVARNLKGSAEMHRAGLESIPNLRGAITVATIEVDRARDLLRDQPPKQGTMF